MPYTLSAVERLLKVMADGSRLRILQALSGGERSVSEILEQTALPQTLASFHLRVLRESGLLVTERRGPFIFYRLRDDSLPNLLEACGTFGESLGEAEADRVPRQFWPTVQQLMRTQRRPR